MTPMAFQIPSTDYLAVLVAGIAYFGLGALWYSPLLFGNHWMRAMGKTEEEIKSGGMGHMALVGMFIVSLVSVTALAWFLAFADVEDVAGAVAVALIASFGFVLVPLAANVFFESKPWSLFTINFGYHTAGTILAALVLGLWP